jgi:ornithine cyclodeaminase
MSLPWIDAATVAARTPYPALVAALDQPLGTRWALPLRASNPVPGPAPFDLLTMPGWTPEGQAGVKLVTVQRSTARPGPMVHALYVAFDAHGVPCALIDGDSLTARRTAAISALAARRLARRQPGVHLVVGAGRIAAASAQAFAALGLATHTLVWARRAEQAQVLADTLKAEGIAAGMAPDLEAAVRSADLITTATGSTTPLVLGAWLAEGAHLTLAGSYRPERVEADAEALRNAAVVVDDRVAALAEAGELIQAIAADAFSPADIAGDAADLCTPGWRAPHRHHTLFKTVGTAHLDAIAARLILAGERARPAKVSENFTV